MMMMMILFLQLRDIPDEFLREFETWKEEVALLMPPPSFFASSVVILLRQDLHN